jgi:hypothetical protein
MKRNRWILAILFLASIEWRGAAADERTTIPRYFEPRFGGEPVWIAATEAISASGTLRPDVRRPAYLKTPALAQREARPNVDAADAAASCDVTFGAYFDEGPDDGVVTSLAQLTELAATRLVTSGSVTASEVGLYNGIPFTILQIDVDSKDTSGNRVYLMYPRGRLRFDGVTFCNESTLSAELPAIGDHIVFVASAPVDSAGTLFNTPLVLYEHDAALVPPPGLRLEADSRRQSLRTIAAHLREARREERQ